MITDDVIEQYADSYLPSNEISKLIDIDRNTIQKWHRAGKVRMRHVEKREKHKPFYLYHVGDTIAVRLKRPKPKPFKHCRIDGVLHYQCNTCDSWKPRDGFYDDKRNEQHGILSQCKACHNRLARERSKLPETRVKWNERARKRSQERAENARAATEWAANPTIPASFVLDAVLRVRPNNTDAEISVEAGMHPDTVRNIRRKADRNGDMFLSTVDSLFTNLNERSVFYEITEFLDEHRPRWHKQYDYCQKCFRTSIPFCAIGLCTTCWRNRKNPDYKPIMESKWALRYARCIRCHCTDARHCGNGLCGRCYQHDRRRAGKR